METSETTDKIIPALVKAQAGIKNPNLNAQVNYGQTKFRYADLSACLEAVRGPLLAEGIVVVQDVSPLDENGVAVVTRLLHTSGQFIASSPLPMPVKAHDPQAVGSATTYGKRYTLCSLLGIVGEDDDDGQRAQQAKPEVPPQYKLSQKRGAAILQMINETKDRAGLDAVWAGLTVDERKHPKIIAAKDARAAEVSA